MAETKSRTGAYRNSAPTTIEVAGNCEVCLDGVSIVSARFDGGHFVKCLNCGVTYSVGDTDSGVATDPVSSSVPGGGGQTSGLPGGPTLTQPQVLA